jgi:glutamate-1-semialdehyde 2,1-aminomutase
MSDALNAALADAISIYVQKRPETAAIHNKARQFMPGGNTRTVLYSEPFPLRIVRAEGARLDDVDGITYIDFLGDYSAGIFGHSDPRIRLSINEAIENGINIGAHSTAEVTFAELVTTRFKLERVRFTNSGTEANMMALAAARHFTGKTAIMTMKGGYHGGSLHFNSGGSPVNAPFDFILGHYNSIDETRALISKNAGRLAAVLLEPMLGSGGCIPATYEFLSMLRSECDLHGIILIIDEVMTSRLYPSGLSANMGIQADLVTLGKYIGGGMSFGAFGGRAEIMDQFDPSRPNALPHAGTFNNNTVTINAGITGMRDIFTGDACHALNSRGEEIRNKLNDMFKSYQASIQVCGIGSLMSIHPTATLICGPKDIENIDSRLRRLIYFHLLDEGVYIAERGYMALSLAITDDHLTGLERALERLVDRNRHLFCGDSS